MRFPCRSKTGRSTVSSRATSTATSKTGSANASSPKRDGSPPSSSWSRRSGETATSPSAGRTAELKDGSEWQVYKRVFAGPDLAAELEGEVRVRGSVVRRRAGLTRRRSSYRSLASLQRDLRVCRACAEAGYSPRVFASRERPARAARLYVRPGAGHRRRRGTETLARAGREDPAPLARAGRGRVLPNVLLRVRDAVLSRARRLRSRRPHADSTRARALLVLEELGARAGRARS